MSTLMQKETRELLKDLEAQGAVLEEVKSGYRVLFPNGDTTVIHWTTSDWRATKNLRGDIKRAGFTWLFDTEEMKEKTVGKYLDPETRAKLDKMVAESGNGPVFTRELINASGTSDPTVRKALRQAGYVQTGRGVWMLKSALPDGTPTLPTPPARTPRLVSPDGVKKHSTVLTALQEEKVAEFLLAIEGEQYVTANRLVRYAGISPNTASRRLVKAGYVQVSRGKWVKQRPVLVRHLEAVPTPHNGGAEAMEEIEQMEEAVEFEYPEISKAAALVHRVNEQLPAEEPRTDERELAEVKLHRGTVKAVEHISFIDDRDSWTISVPKKLQELAEQMGLNVEVRVWRDK